MNDYDHTNWGIIRDTSFHANDDDFHNLNPGTMGTTSKDVINAINQFINTYKNPLDIYKEGRSNLKKIRKEAEILWPNSNYELAIGGSTTYWCNKLSDSFQKIWPANDLLRPIRLITSTHEHKGALLNFEENPSYEVLKVNDLKLNNPKDFRDILRNFNPHLALFSQKTWDSNLNFPVRDYFNLIQEVCPRTIRILDSAQSIGMDNLEFDCSEIIVCSGHKWLFGPQGSGFMWIHKCIIDKIPRFHFGERIDPDSKASIFEESGGQNFILYAGILESLRLLKKIGQQKVKERSLFLAKYFFDILKKSFLRKNFIITQNESVILLDWIKPINNLPYEYYQSLHKAKIYCKFIKIQDKNTFINRLRFGIPYFETKSNLEFITEKMESILYEIFENE